MGGQRTLGLLVLRCETTGKPVHSGVPFTQKDLDRIRNAKIHLQCPACGELHGFGFADASIENIERHPAPEASEPDGGKSERRRR
jgi:hypothetical protein